MQKCVCEVTVQYKQMLILKASCEWSSKRIKLVSFVVNQINWLHLIKMDCLCLFASGAAGTAATQPLGHILMLQQNKTGIITQPGSGLRPCPLIYF